MIAVKSVLGACASALAIMGCAPTGHDSGDQRGNDLDGTTQELTVPVCSGGRFVCKSRVRVDEHNRIKPFATPAGLGPADLVSAYKLNATITSTATIAIVDAFHYANAESDLATYRSTFGLPPCTVASECLTILNPSGAGAPPAGDDWNLEAALDLDMASAACPTCKLVLVEAQDDVGNGLFNLQNTAAALAGVVSISNSWGRPSPGNDTSLDSQFFTHLQAVNVFVSSGDNGNTGSMPDYPSTSAHVIAVGGTHLVRSTVARGWAETAWSGTGSSCSTLITKPGYQSVVPISACAKRATADVSAVADPNTGVAVFNANDGGFIVVGGTSASSPFVAGVFARYGISGASHDASFVYMHTSEFFDVITGRNGNCRTALCDAGPGWDGPTGVGTPNGSVLNNGICTPNCTGKTCGPDGCPGGSCGSCLTGDVCTPGGQCCPPQCSGKNCGDDKCDGSCGSCSAGQACSTSGTCMTISCVHPICSIGDKLTTTCDPCAGEICDTDAYCCNNAWDSICVGEVTSVCHQSCGGGPCGHSLCATGSKLPPSCDSCVGRICAVNPYCCDNTWDAQCVSAVISLCHESCG